MESLSLVQKLVIASVAVVGLLFLAAQLIPDDVQPGPCSQAGHPGRCYHFEEAVCEVVWKKASDECDEAIKKMALPPGRLIGPVMAKCQLIHLDQAFAYSRKEIPECRETFQKLENWKRQGDFQ